MTTLNALGLMLCEVQNSDNAKRSCLMLCEVLPSDLTMNNHGVTWFRKVQRKVEDRS